MAYNVCETSSLAITYVPKDLMFDVLSRLPAKNVGRLKCLSKSWCDLIDNDKDFSDFNLNHSDANSSMIIMHDPFNLSEEKPQPYFFTIDSETKDIKEISYPPGLWQAIKDYNYPPECNYDIDEILPILETVSSTHGVICMRYEFNGTKIAIWNPLSQRYREISYPKLDHCPDWSSRICFGFGYEKTTNDYKVVVLLNCQNGKFVALPDHDHAWIYSYKLNTWKTLEKFSYTLLRQEKNGVFCSGALHWDIKEKDGSEMILRFDLFSEKFDLIRRPPNCHGNTLSILGDRICLTQCNKTQEGFQIWVMNNNDSWSKMINLVDHNLQSFVKGSFYIKVVAYYPVKRKLVIWKKNFHDKDVLFLYDLVDRSIEILYTDLYIEPLSYAETLRML